ncbi:MAG TPA: DNA-formamidopyrimidine glycosylase family protein, partial [Polyangiaceae bacterium]|nr:DNA-formamidopyrimidine glycosylase family protein [Polyangiaceae bacterium]
MPEYPDVVVYLERLQAVTAGQKLEGVRLRSPFLLRSYEPPLSATFGRSVLGFRRIGKRLVFELEGDLYLVLHLMIAGRLRQREPKALLKTKVELAAFDFTETTIVLTEAGTQKRASLHVVQGEAGLEAFRRGGVDPFAVTLTQFRAALTRENRTLKRALTDPTIIDGVGNAYSDEMLHRARLSPVKRTQQLSPDESKRLFSACKATLSEWTERLRQEVGAGFPDKVTAFREGMAVHGRYRQPCPVCQTPVQRIRYAANEVNYCPTCQTNGRLLADRALSRLLKSDWPKSLDELDERLHPEPPAPT